MEPLNFRRYEPSDMPGRIAAINMGWPGFPVTQEEIETQEALNPVGKILDRFVCGSHSSGPILASAMETYWYQEPGQFQIVPAMNPASGPYLETYKFLMEHIAQYDPKWMVSPSRTDIPRRSEALVELGFVELERSPLSRILVDDFNARDSTAAIQFVAEQGLRLISFEQLESEGFDWDRQLFEATNEMVIDIPTENPFQPLNFEEEQAEFRNRFAYTPGLMHAVMDGSKIAAYTRLRRFKADPTIAFTEFSGTCRGYRRRGLIKAVKAVSLHNAKTYGIKQVLTDNLEKNPMYQINLELGFQVWTHIQMFKREW